jgi:transcriptional repressor NrdR
MRCPYCRHADSRVVDSREAEDGQIIRRRRSCPECGRRFTTVEEAVLAVVKRSGVTEPFSRSKIVAGVRKACQGRPVDEDAIALLAQKVEETVRARGAAELPSHEVGLAILAPLRELDEVAYLRFASVYRSFDSLGDFEREIASLRAGAAQQPANQQPGQQSGHQTAQHKAQGEGQQPAPVARTADRADVALTRTAGMRTARPVG